MTEKLKMVLLVEYEKDSKVLESFVTQTILNRSECALAMMSVADKDIKEVENILRINND